MTWHTQLLVLAVAALSKVSEGRRVLKSLAGSLSSTSTWESCGVKGGAGTEDLGVAIVNGQDADHCEWRWQVGLRQAADSLMPFCGGSLIDTQWVLTAAHCMVMEEFYVTAGDHSANTTSGYEQVRKAVQSTKHPYYDSKSMIYDIALVKLETPMELGECVGTVCLPTDGQDIPLFSQCWITGWGTLKSGGAQPDVLKEAAVSVINNKACVENYDYFDTRIHSTMICAQGQNAAGGNTDACQGDSGGPLVCQAEGKWVLFGDTSWGYGCAQSNYPGIYSRVHESLDFVHATMTDSEYVPPPTEAPLSCPKGARKDVANFDGDCSCPFFKYCSMDGGKTKNCPRSDYGNATHVFPNMLFQATCTDCKCYWVWKKWR